MQQSAYTGKQDQWDRFSSIRSRPRRYICKDVQEYFFPVSRQPLCVHPILTAMGDSCIEFVLTQSAYKFMYEIAMLETEMVNAAACKVANNRLSFQFPDDLRHDALTVIIDEAYHAFVAVDFMKQIENKTGIKPIEMPNESPNTLAIKFAHANLPEALHDAFELIAVCISEHTLTKELINIGKESKMLKSFSDVMADHVLDEGRHAMIFSEILAMFWASFSENDRTLIGEQLPKFIREYLDTKQQITFDRHILQALSLSEQQINQIIEETHIEHDPSELRNVNPVIPNIIKLLERTQVLAHPGTRACFITDKLLDA